MALTTNQEQDQFIAEALRQYKRGEFHASHVMFDLFGTDGRISAFKPGGLPKLGFLIDPKDPEANTPKVLFESGTVSYRRTVDDEGNPVVIVSIISAEGRREETVKDGDEVFISYGPSDITGTGWNAWFTGSWQKRVEWREDPSMELGGEYVTKPLRYGIIPVIGVIPPQLKDQGIERRGNVYTFPWEWGKNGVGEAPIGNAYWVINAERKPNGDLDYYCLTRGEAGYEQFHICSLTPDGEIDRDLGRLADLDPVR